MYSRSVLISLLTSIMLVHGSLSSGDLGLILRADLTACQAVQQIIVSHDHMDLIVAHQHPFLTGSRQRTLMVSTDAFLALS